MAKREMKTANTIENELVENVEATVEEPVMEPITGVVIGCNKLNVRKKPGLKSEVVTVINAKTKLTINLEESAKDWYKVTVKPGVEGYCMKKYVKTK